ncbi:MAG TPA: hypothetical protein VF499_16235 [Afipia sp.]
MERRNIALTMAGVAALGCASPIAWIAYSSGGAQQAVPQAAPVAPSDAVPTAEQLEAEPVAAMDEALEFCMRGNDSRITGHLDEEFGDLAGNPRLADELVPACQAVAQQHPDRLAQAAANVVLARAAEANGEDGGWYRRRAEEIAPDAKPVRLLALDYELATVEASAQTFNDVSPLRKRLTALAKDLPAPVVTELGKRIDAAELRGGWNNRELVRMAVLGTPPSHPIDAQARISFMQGVSTACEAFGFKPTINQSLGAGMQRLDNMLSGKLLLEQESYTDGAAVGRALDCGGARLTQAYQRVAEPIAAGGDALIASAKDLWNRQ